MSHESFEYSERLRPGLGYAYELFHRAIPSEVVQAFRSAGVVDWRIYRNGEILTHEVVADDRERMAELLSTDAASEIWRRQVASYLSVEEVACPSLEGKGYLIWELSWSTRQY